MYFFGGVFPTLLLTSVASLAGFRSLDKIIGRSDLLRPRADGAVRSNVPQPALAPQPPKQGKPKKLSKILGLKMRCPPNMVLVVVVAS